jgi:hypothetical protein
MALYCTGIQHIQYINAYTVWQFAVFLFVVITVQMSFSFFVWHRLRFGYNTQYKKNPYFYFEDFCIEQYLQKRSSGPHETRKIPARAFRGTVPDPISGKITKLNFLSSAMRRRERRRYSSGSDTKLLRLLHQ